MKHKPYRTCKYCGAHLDPEERCGCREHVDKQRSEEDNDHDSNSDI